MVTGKVRHSSKCLQMLFNIFFSNCRCPCGPFACACWWQQMEQKQPDLDRWQWRVALPWVDDRLLANSATTRSTKNERRRCRTGSRQTAKGGRILWIRRKRKETWQKTSNSSLFFFKNIQSRKKVSKDQKQRKNRMHTKTGSEKTNQWIVAGLRQVWGIRNKIIKKKTFKIKYSKIESRPKALARKWTTEKSVVSRVS